MAGGDLGPLGASWAPSVPVFVAGPAVVAFVQGVTLLLGLGLAATASTGPCEASARGFRKLN